MYFLQVAYDCTSFFFLIHSSKEIPHGIQWFCIYGHTTKKSSATIYFVTKVILRYQKRSYNTLKVTERKKSKSYTCNDNLFLVSAFEGLKSKFLLPRIFKRWKRERKDGKNEGKNVCNRTFLLSIT